MDYVMCDPKLLNEIKPYSNSYGSDLVKIDKQTDERLYTTILNQDINSVIETPSDIVFANTIPIKDLEIEVDETNDGGSVVRYRTIIFDDLSNITDSGDTKEIGYLIIYYKRQPAFIYVLAVNSGIEYIFVNRAWSRFNTPSIVNIFTNTWYAIEVMLLHPKLKTIFLNPQTIPIHNHTNAKGQGKQKVKYIKKHYVSLTDVENITRPQGKDRIRKCLIWYVVGHWRTYGNGKRVFIQGYWKGELRALKQNVTERERAVI